MKKIKYMLIVLLLGVFILPFNVKANEKIDVYFFRGEGCSYCAAEEEFFAKLDDEFKELFSLKSYETWYNEDNHALLEKVAAKLGDQVDGVPYTVVGNQSFNGFSDEIAKDIKAAIENEYNSEDRYIDIVAIIDDNKGTLTGNPEKSDSKIKTSDIIVSIVAILVIAGFVTMIIIARKKQ